MASLWLWTTLCLAVLGSIVQWQTVKSTLIVSQCMYNDLYEVQMCDCISNSFLVTIYTSQYVPVYYHIHYYVTLFGIYPNVGFWLIFVCGGCIMHPLSACLICMMCVYVCAGSPPVGSMTGQAFIESLVTRRTLNAFTMTIMPYCPNQNVPTFDSRFFRTGKLLVYCIATV